MPDNIESNIRVTKNIWNDNMTYECNCYFLKLFYLIKYSADDNN